MNVGKKTRVVLVLLILTISVAVALYIGAGKNSARALVEKMAEKVDLQAKDVRYTQVGSGGMKLEITAESVSYQKQGDLALFEKMKARIVLKDGRTFHVSGDKGRLNTLSKDMNIEGNVVVASEAGERLHTEQLLYRDELKRIETDKPVFMENRNARIDGVGMVFYLKEERVAILSRVRAKSLSMIAQER